MIENCFLVIKITNNTGAAAEVNGQYGNVIVSECQLISAGKVLTSHTPFTRSCLMSRKPYQVKKNLEKMFGFHGGSTPQAVANGATGTYYVPLMFSHFDLPSLNINSNFYENLNVRVRLCSANRYSSDGQGANAAPVAFQLNDVKLVQVHRLLPSQLEQKQISVNFGGDQESLVKVQNDCIGESSVSAAGAIQIGANQTLSHTLTTNRCISKLFIAVEDTGYDNNIDAMADGKYLHIDNIKIVGSGQTIIDQPADLIAMGCGQDIDCPNSSFAVGNYFDTAFPHTQNIYCYQFCMNEDTSGHNTGMLSTREVNALTVSVQFTSAAARPHRIRVGFVSPLLSSINAASGKISTSLSS